MYIDLDSEVVWTGSDMGGKNKNPRRLEGDTNIVAVEFISGLRVDTGVVRIGFFRGGYSDGVIVYTNEGWQAFLTEWILSLMMSLSSAGMLRGRGD